MSNAQPEGMTHVIENKMRVLGLVLVLTWLFPYSALAVTSVSNSVSVSASGGESNASISTTINGETVEATTITDKESITYNNEILIPEPEPVSLTTTSAPAQDVAQVSELHALLSKLSSLLTLYVSILTN